MQWTGDLIDVAMTDSRQSLLEGESILANIKTNYACRTSTKRLGSRTVKEEMRENFLKMLSSDQELFPGIVGYDDTVIPEINIAILSARHVFSRGKGQAKVD